LTGASGTLKQQVFIAGFELGPQGAYFNPAITLSFKYDKNALPAGVAEKDLFIGIYNGVQWVKVAQNLDSTSNTVSTNIIQVATYALFGEATATPSTTTTTPATTTSTTTTKPATVTVTSTVTVSATTPAGDDDGGFNWWLLIGIIAGVLVLVIAALIIIQKRRSLH